MPYTPKIHSEDFTFLLASERSGSNLITKMFDSHSKFCGPATKHILNPLGRNIFRYQPFTKKSWRNLISHIDGLINVNFTSWKSTIETGELLATIEEGNLGSLLHYIFEKEAIANQKTHLFIKEIKVHEFYPFLKHYFPNASFVLLVRDPRDVALSWKKSSNHKGGVVAAARQWKIDQQKYCMIHNLEKNKKNSVIVSYESLIEEPKITLSNALSIYPFSFEENMLNYNKNQITVDNAAKSESWKNLSQKILTGNKKKYINELAEKEILAIEKICFYEMDYLNYQSEHSIQEIKKRSWDKIEHLHQSELKNIKYSPSNGVKDNMAAKKKFYQYPRN